MGIRLTLDPNVRFHGVIGGERKNLIINHSSALVFPVRWHEPFGIAMIEALYFGCPVFGTPYGSLPEIVIPEVGVLADSESELARRLGDIGQFDRRRCHQYACDEFSAELMTRRYLALYERVLNGESLHDHEPVTSDGSDPKPLPLGR
jgi:glycosyltransferase involved in cell wall biosynthesis